MRTVHLLLAFAALIGASPALADVTARYVPAGDNGQPLLIEADEAGRIRVEDARQTLLILGEEAFIIRRGEDGTFTARLEDFAAVTLEFFTQFMGGSEAQDSFARLRFEARPGAAETIGPWRGTLHSIVQITPAPDAGAARMQQPMEFVMSDDPALRTLAPAAGRAFLTITTMVGSFMPPDMARAMREVLARGAPLRINRAYRLESVSDAPIAADRFARPTDVLSREQLRQRTPR